MPYSAFVLPSDTGESLPTNASKRFLDLLVHLARIKTRVAQELVPLPISTASTMEVSILLLDNCRYCKLCEANCSTICLSVSAAGTVSEFLH